MCECECECVCVSVSLIVRVSVSVGVSVILRMRVGAGGKGGRGCGGAPGASPAHGLSLALNRISPSVVSLPQLIWVECPGCMHSGLWWLQV
jgi:hypothetical protein